LATSCGSGDAAHGDGRDELSEELRLTSPKNETYDFVVGLYYFNMTDHQYDPITFGPGFTQLGAPFTQYGGVPLISYAYVGTQSYAAYANAPLPFSCLIRRRSGLIGC
jgi:hypothetical protein